MELKEYFKQRYQGSESFLQNVVYPIFGEESFEESGDRLLDNNPELETIARTTGIAAIERVGSIYIGVTCIDIFDIRVASHVQLTRNRVGVQQLVRRIMSTYSSAFMLFHYDDDAVWDWRFSFCSKRENSDTSDSKRYTFLLGPGQSCRTAADNFQKLFDKHGDITVEDIETAFDVEALSKEFFEKYKLHYERFVEYITGKRFVKEGGKWKEKTIHEPHAQMYADFGSDDKRVRDYVKKLLGRIVFLHFLQKKGWLGVPVGKQWGEGDMQFMKHLFDHSTPEQRADYLDTVLEPLFAQGIDTEREGGLYDTHVALPTGSTVRIPYLNGGLFERDELDEIPTQFPEEFFADLLDFFYQYNFTIDENDPNDAQVGVDPEMLGRIFENLLEDNKDKGAFYTPKEIVQYMCRQSLTAYLQTGIDSEADRSAIAAFVETYNVSVLPDGLKDTIDQRLKDVKICDPAIGSGAFPMGLLKELFLCRGAIEDFSNATDIKRHIIQNNIYGVDIERGAVDIARLRFWLSLVVDEQAPEALPNLDYKIMQGNSLLEQYQGVDLSAMTERKKLESDSYSLFENMLDVYRKELRDKLSTYYNCDDHDERKTLRQEIADNVKQQLSEQCCRIDFGDLDLAANTEFFLWHTWFYDVFAQGGFDIVIGNPPYVTYKGKQKVVVSDEMVKTLLDVYKNSAEYKINSYALFVEAGINLAKFNGVLSLIIPGTILQNQYLKKIRKYLVTNEHILQIVTFENKVFDAVTDSIILQCSKGLSEGVTSYIRKTDLDFSKQVEVRCFDQKKWLDEASDYVINLKIDSTDVAVCAKIEKAGDLLGTVYNVYVGIVANGIKKFLSTDKSTANHKKYLQGKHIAPYDIKFQGLYINFIKEALHSNTDESVYNLPEKILVRKTGKDLIAALDTNQYFTDQSLYNLFLKNGANYNNKVLLAILNSKLMNYYYNKKMITNVDVFPYIKGIHLKAFPLARQTNKFWKMTIEDVDAINRCGTYSSQYSIIKQRIDHLVYHLYGLTYDEVLVIDPETPITREEYDNYKTEETPCQD